MSSRTALLGGMTLACVTCGVAVVTVPDPTFRGRVVEDVTQHGQRPVRSVRSRGPRAGLACADARRRRRCRLSGKSDAGRVRSWPSYQASGESCAERHQRSIWVTPARRRR